MHLASPLATLVGGHQAAALRVLARTDAGMTGRQVARVAQAGNTAIKRALDKLEHAGLVKVDRSLHSSSYRVNEDHVLWPALRLALDAPRVLDERIGQLVDESGVAVTSVSVFGSVARGEATDDSDVDLVVIYPGEPVVDLSVALGSAVERWTGNECQVFDVSRADLRRMVADGDPLVDSWRRDARTIVGEDLRGLL
jgi:predicted nucleotidyltransferase